MIINKVIVLLTNEHIINWCFCVYFLDNDNYLFLALFLFVSFLVLFYQGKREKWNSLQYNFVVKYYFYCARYNYCT